MKALQTLPPGYREIYRVDLQKDKKTALFVNGLALLIAAVMGVGIEPAGSHFVPLSDGRGAAFIRTSVRILVRSDIWLSYPA